MMILTEDYIKLSQVERQAHLDLQEACLERGGYSTQHKGVLVSFLDTDFPKGAILLCHACNNAKCSNPRHLYWGTYKENTADAMACGTHATFWQRLVEKYGEDKAKQMQAEKAKSSNIKRAKRKKAAVAELD